MFYRRLIRNRPTKKNRGKEEKKKKKNERTQNARGAEWKIQITKKKLARRPMVAFWRFAHPKSKRILFLGHTENHSAMLCGCCTMHSGSGCWADDGWLMAVAVGLVVWTGYTYCIRACGDARGGGGGYLKLLRIYRIRALVVAGWCSAGSGLMEGDSIFLWDGDLKLIFYTLKMLFHFCSCPKWNSRGMSL